MAKQKMSQERSIADMIDDANYNTEQRDMTHRPGVPVSQEELSPRKQTGARNPNGMGRNLVKKAIYNEKQRLKPKI